MQSFYTYTHTADLYAKALFCYVWGLPTVIPVKCDTMTHMSNWRQMGWVWETMQRETYTHQETLHSEILKTVRVISTVTPTGNFIRGKGFGYLKWGDDPTLSSQKKKKTVCVCVWCLFLFKHAISLFEILMPTFSAGLCPSTQTTRWKHTRGMKHTNTPLSHQILGYKKRTVHDHPADESHPLWNPQQNPEVEPSTDQKLVVFQKECLKFKVY